jgi:hypothetical protein
MDKTKKKENTRLWAGIMGRSNYTFQLGHKGVASGMLFHLVGIDLKK